MRVDHDQPLGTGGGQRVGDDPGADGLAGLAAAVLPRIPEIGYDGRDPLRAGAAAGVEQQEQLEEMVADRRSGGLDDVHVVAAQVTYDWAQLTVREPCQLARHRLGAQHLGDSTREPWISAAGHDPQAHRCLIRSVAG